MRTSRGWVIGIFYFAMIIGVVPMAKALDLSDVRGFNVQTVPVILRKTQSYGDIVAFQITARGGVSVATKAGALELLIKTMSSGTPSYSKEAIDKIFTESAAAFSVDPHYDYIEVSLKCLKRFLPRLLPIISEMLRMPMLDEKEIELSRAQMMAELKNEQDHPDSILGLNSHKAFYRNHPYLSRPNGFLETLPMVQRQDLTALLPKVFNLNNIFITAVGDLTAEETTELITQYFLSLPMGERHDPAIAPIDNDTKEISFQKLESPTTYFLAKFKAPALKDDDYPALVLATQILRTRLFEEVRTKRALTYAVSSGLGNSANNSGQLYVSSTQLHEAVKVMFDEVKKMQTVPIEPKTIELEIRKFTSTWYLGRELSSSQAEIFALYEAIGTGWENSYSFIDRLNKVTPDQIMNVSKNYFKDYTVAMVGPEQIDISDVLTQFPSLKKPEPVVEKKSDKKMKSAAKPAAKKPKAKKTAQSK